MSLPKAARARVRDAGPAIVHEQVDEVELPGADGYFGVLPGHAPLLAALRVGEMWYRKGQEKYYLSLAVGFAEVLPDSRDDPGAGRRARRGHRRGARGGGARSAPRSGSRSRRPTSTSSGRASRCSKAMTRLQVARARDAARHQTAMVRSRLSSCALQLGRASHPGLRRQTNEDTYCTRPDLGLFVVADGMGGHAAGEIASRIAVEAIEGFITDTVDADSTSTWPFPFDTALSLDGNRLKAAFRLANRRLGDGEWPRSQDAARHGDDGVRRCSSNGATPASRTSATAACTAGATARSQRSRRITPGSRSRCAPA